MSALPVPAKVALITVAGAGVFLLRYIVGHASTVLILAAVVTAIYALVSAKRRQDGLQERVATRLRTDPDNVEHVLGQTTHYGLPHAQAQQQSAAWSIADAVRHH